MNIKQIKNTLKKFQAENRRKFRNTQAEFKKAVFYIKKRSVSYYPRWITLISFFSLSFFFFVKLWHSHFSHTCVGDDCDKPELSSSEQFMTVLRRFKSWVSFDMQMLSMIKYWAWISLPLVLSMSYMSIHVRCAADS